MILKIIKPPKLSVIKDRHYLYLSFPLRHPLLQNLCVPLEATYSCRWSILWANISEFILLIIFSSSFSCCYFRHLVIQHSWFDLKRKTQTVHLETQHFSKDDVICRLQSQGLLPLQNFNFSVELNS